MLGDAGGREHERERMSAGDPVQARRLGPVHPAPLEHELRVRLFERAQREVAEALEREPAGERPFPPGEHERDTGRQRRHEHLPKPRVHEPEQLVVVQRETAAWCQPLDERLQGSVPSAAKRPRSVGSTVRQSSCTPPWSTVRSCSSSLRTRNNSQCRGCRASTTGRVLTLMDELFSCMGSSARPTNGWPASASRLSSFGATFCTNLRLAAGEPYASAHRPRPHPPLPSASLPPRVGVTKVILELRLRRPPSSSCGRAA